LARYYYYTNQFEEAKLICEKLLNLDHCCPIKSQINSIG